ncbi:MAG: hypothetical protein JSU94_14245 [Phycisphaerales bacterium]|nr:MAG: hypothetical protein JSU94_14245 [Phycisphaerales bacterium]
MARCSALCRVLILCLLAVSGCKKPAEPKVDENRPLDEVKAEAEKMNAKQLRTMAMKYKEAAAAKTSEADKIFLKLKDTPDVTSLKGEIDSVNKSISALTDRYFIYFNELKKKGGDLSGLEF